MSFFVRILLTLIFLVPFVSYGQVQRSDEIDFAGAKLLMRADELIYDNDSGRIIARNNVELEYEGHRLLSDSVIYDQSSRRLQAFGGVELLYQRGERIFADELDITDDFGEGFIRSLRIETRDSTYMTAASGRHSGLLSELTDASYTACAPCEDDPDKVPLWRVKSAKIIRDGESQTITYENAGFEVMGVPVLWIPWFSHGDIVTERKSGFLAPTLKYDKDLGLSYRQPYFWLLDDTRDFTLTGTAYGRQGLLGHGLYRERLDSGEIEFELAGIDQQSPETFLDDEDREEFDRGMFASRGRFDLGNFYEFGWDGLVQSDESFSETYDIENYSTANITNRVYLTGLSDRSTLNLSSYHYDVQGGSTYQVEDEQAFVRPVFDYNYLSILPDIGGDLSFDVNVTSLSREDLSADFSNVGAVRTYGIEGDVTRASARLGWKRRFGYSGLVMIPSASLYGDGVWTDGVHALNDESKSEVINSEARFMPEAGFEISYPLLASGSGVSHIIDPVTQFLVRPDLDSMSVLPNEDSQSVIFDSTSLFSPTRFSGYDRIESGSRANIGVRYSMLASDISFDGVLGRSYHLGSDNPYSHDDFVYAGSQSGLDSRGSDYVAGIGAMYSGFSFNSQARFGSSELDWRRLESIGSYSSPNWNVSGHLTLIRQQPLLGFIEDRREFGLGGQYRLTDDWHIFGNGSYDIENDSLVKNSLGIGYEDSCVFFALTYSGTRDRYRSGADDQTISFRLSLRTLGEVGDDGERFGENN